MESVVQWLTSWVSAPPQQTQSAGSVRATDLSDVGRSARSSRHCFDLCSMGPHGSIIRLAGVSGALAICFGAYGAHSLREQSDVPQERVLAFQVGNRYHLIHSVAMLAVPFASKPMLTGALFATGTLIFSGSCYYYAMTGSNEIRRITPSGGFILIFAWLSLLI